MDGIKSLGVEDEFEKLFDVSSEPVGLVKTGDGSGIG